MTATLSDTRFEIVTNGPNETRAIGKALGQLLQPGDVVCLQGDLGSGKTCLTQGIGAGLGVTGAINSPTFVYVSEHPSDSGSPWLYHVDLYRISEFVDAISLGLEDYMYGDGVTVIEWADRALELLPTRRLCIHLSYEDYERRRLNVTPIGTRYVDIVLTLRKRLEEAG